MRGRIRSRGCFGLRATIHSVPSVRIPGPCIILNQYGLTKHTKLNGVNVSELSASPFFPLPSISNEIIINVYHLYLFFCSCFVAAVSDQLNFSISRLVRSPESDDEDNNNTYHHEKISPLSQVTSSCKDSCTKSRSRSSSQSRFASRSCSVSPELEVDSPPPPLRINDSPTNTNLFQVIESLFY